MYNRYAESGRVAWANKYARFVDPEHKHAWANLATPKGEVGMILRKITTDFKFVSVLRLGKAGHVDADIVCSR